jgi:Zn-dependent protease with chaperone function
MQLAILTAVLGALAAAETGGGPVGGLAWRLLVVAVSTLVAPLAALVGSQRLTAALAHGEGIDDDGDADDDMMRLHTAVVAAWLGSVGLVLFVGAWPRIVRENWQLAEWPLVDELAILLPVVGPLLLVWAALYRLERAAQVAAFRAQGCEAPAGSLCAYLWLHVRHHLGLILLPPLLIVALFDSLTALHVAPADLDTAWWLVAPLLATMLLIMPVAVRRIWRTTPLPGGALRQLLDEVCRGRKCHVREMLVWHTDATLANAAVVGLSRWLRYVLLSDVLLARLSARQIAAVLRHELGHLRRWHLPLRLALLLLPLAWWMAIERTWPGSLALLRHMAESVGLRTQLVAGLALPLGMLGYAIVVVGWFSRLLEHDADLDACLTDHGQLDALAANDFCDALTMLCGRDRRSSLSEWLHPPVARRLLLVQDFVACPTRARRFRRRLGALTLGLVAAYLGAAIVAVC